MVPAIHSGFEAVIGLEVHCQLATESKIFCGCRSRLAEDTESGELAPNSHVCPVCAGHPGTLPVLNRKVVEYAVKAGLATQCEIRTENVFARKNYFYADLPKGYQISQMDKPICENGWLEIEAAEGPRRIRVQRIHMEEDAGKNVHLPGYSLVNLNRAGTPLIEIVSHPDLRTPAEAGAYLRALHSIVTALEICDGNMQNGNFRCDANVSVRPVGADRLGTRVEIKNVNSFRFVEKAIDFEIARQIEVIKAGGRVIQETRLYDAARDATSSMRSKEAADDYRYFPDPDLIAVHVPEAWVSAWRAELPELPQQKKSRYLSEFGVPPGDASVLTGTVSIAKFFEAVVSELTRAGMAPQVIGKPVTNLICGELIRMINEEGVELSRSRIRTSHVADIVALTQKDSISSTAAKQVLVEAWKTGDSVSDIVSRLGLEQVSDLSALEPIVDQVLAAHPALVADFKSGKEKVLGFLVGQVMKLSGGKANPKMLQDLIRKRIT